MTRLFCFAGVVLTAVWPSAPWHSVKSPTLVPCDAECSRGAGVTSWGAVIGLPGYPMLQMENVQKELGLTPEQKEKLKEIAKKAAESMKGRGSTGRSSAT